MKLFMVGYIFIYLSVTRTYNMMPNYTHSSLNNKRMWLWTWGWWSLLVDVSNVKGILDFFLMFKILIMYMGIYLFSLVSRTSVNIIKSNQNCRLVLGWYHAFLIESIPSTFSKVSILFWELLIKIYAKVK